MSVDVLYPSKEEKARDNKPETRLESLRAVIREREQKERKQMAKNPWIPILFNWLIVILLVALLVSFIIWGIRIRNDRREEAIKEAARQEAVASYIAEQDQAAAQQYFLSGQASKDEARKADALALAKDSGVWKTEAAFKAHCWNVWIRMKSPLYPNSIQDVLTQKSQYAYANLDADTYQTEKVQWATEVLEQAETGQLPAYLTLDHLFEEMRSGGMDCVLHTEYDRGPGDDPWRYRE